jgi:hypothetical protein
MKELKDKSNDELILEVKNLQAQLLTQTEKTSLLQLQNDEYDKLMGYKQGMTYEDKVKHNQESENDLKNAEDSMDENSVKREYLEETEIGDRMVDIALEMNQLHFDCAEVFHPIKEGLTDHEYEVYKKHKRNFYGLVSYFYNIKREDRNEVFDILIKAVKMQRDIYTLDEELKGLQG